MADPINLLPEELLRRKRVGQEEVVPVPLGAVPKFGIPTHLLPEKFWSNLKQFLSDYWIQIIARKDSVWPAGIQPVMDKELGSRDEDFGWIQAISVGVHAGLIALLMVPFLKLLPPKIVEIDRPVLHATRLQYSPYKPKPAARDDGDGGGGGGGGDHSLTAAGKGFAPKFADRQIVRSTEVLNSPKPILPVAQTLIGPPELEIANPNMNRIGDPMSKLLEASNGPGKGGGIGSGNGTGIGSGDGEGLGQGGDSGVGGGAYHKGTPGVGGPSCFYMPNPPYSEEARKAKYSGVVLVDAVVAVDGRVTAPRILKSPGLGLDDVTLATMKTWRCRAGMGPSRRPVPTEVQFEVNFRLY